MADDRRAAGCADPKRAMSPRQTAAPLHLICEKTAWVWRSIKNVTVTKSCQQIIPSVTAILVDRVDLRKLGVGRGLDR